MATRSWPNRGGVLMADYEMGLFTSALPWAMVCVLMFPLLAEQNDSLAFGLVLAIVGMAVVFTALAVLALVIAGLTRCMPDKPVPTTTLVSGSGLDGRTLAVITAAAAVAAGVGSQSIRIERVQPVDSH